MVKILISACLLGENVRYNAGSSKVNSTILDRWKNEGRLIPVCPEILGDLPVPRPPSEIIGGDGKNVLGGEIKILNSDGEDVSSNFIKGARKTLEIVNQYNVLIAILKSNSPSCGIGRIYDGTFSGKLKKGDGVTAALLKQNGIQLYSENQIEQVDEAIKRLEFTNEFRATH